MAGTGAVRRPTAGATAGSAIAAVAAGTAAVGLTGGIAVAGGGCAVVDVIGLKVEHAAMSRLSTARLVARWCGRSFDTSPQHGVPHRPCQQHRSGRDPSSARQPDW